MQSETREACEELLGAGTFSFARRVSDFSKTADRISAQVLFRVNETDMKYNVLS
jgi:hypothetical protein